MTPEQPRAATGRWPYRHRTMEEVWAAERAQRAIDLRGAVSMVKRP